MWCALGYGLIKRNIIVSDSRSKYVLYIYIYIYGLMGRMFANGPESH